MRAPRALVFDLDGTLVDTRLDIAAASNHALSAVGAPRRTAEEISAFVGNGSRQLLARLLGEDANARVVDTAMARFLDFYERHPADRSALLPGVREALDACADLPLAVSTNKPRPIATRVLDAFGLSVRFRVVVAGGDTRLKPDPAPILLALSPLGLDGADAWVIGDGPQDVKAGRAAGASTVGVLGGFTDEAALRACAPDRILGTLGELAPLLAEVRASQPAGR